MRLRWSWILGTLTVAAVAGGLYVGPQRRGIAESREPLLVTAQQHGGAHHDDRDHGAAHSGTAHEHPAVPPEYASAHLDPAQWTNLRTVEHGRTIYAERCAACHGERGDGQGPGAKGLKPAPASFRDAHMMAEMSDAYMFWRVSEGNTAEPFKGQGSAMPPWKLVLSTDDRWAVIAYLHSFSGHDGPHTAAAHREQQSASSHEHSSSSRTAPDHSQPSAASHDHSHGSSPPPDHSPPTAAPK